MKLKMVAGKTYACPPIFGAERVITRGEVVEVNDEAQAKALLSDVYTDIANNEHPYFKQVADDATGEEEEATAEATGKAGKAGKSTTTRSRTRATVEQ